MPVENRAKEVQLAVAVAQHAVLPDDVSKSTSTMNEGLATAKDSKGRRQQGRRQTRQPKGQATNKHSPGA